MPEIVTYFCGMNAIIYNYIHFIAVHVFLTLEVSWTVPYEITLVRQSICPSAC